MKKFIFILAILLPILGGAQIHSGIEKMPDQSKYQKEKTCYKYSVSKKVSTECKAIVFSDAIVIRTESTIIQFDLVYPNVYRDNKGKLVEMTEDIDYYVIRATAQTLYLIKK